MMVTAVVMAGGKGSRLALAEEKPLITIGGKPVIEYVLEAVKNAHKIHAMVVTVSKNTPKTAKYITNLHVQALKTPGKEYVSDLAYAIKTLKLDTVLAVPADMPLLKGEIIDDIVEHFYVFKKPAMTVAVPVELRRKLGLGLGYAFQHGDRCLIPTSINMINGARIDEGELEEAVYVLDRVEVAVNFNTVEELAVAEKEFNAKGKGALL